MTKRISNKGSEAAARGFPFKQTMLAMCVGAALQPTAWAQTEGTSSDADEVKKASQSVLEEVTVYGVRASLRSAQDIKKNADTHVDAISASDINALPDVSVLEALQRVPGVSIERFAAINDPDHFSTEGSGVTLRGLPNTRSEFNGRDTFSANSGRGLSFQDVSPELLGSVEIFKNQTADMIEGGISGTINLNTRKPFDAQEQVLSISAQGNYGDLEKEWTPSFSGLYSDRWELEGGEIGVLASYSNSELDFRSDGVQFGFHRFDEASGRYTPINAGVRTTSTARDREAISLAVQYENTDATFSVLGEYLRSDSGTNWTEFAFFSDDAGGSPAANAVYDSNGVFQSGTIENIAGGLGPQTRQQDSNLLTQDFSLELGFQATEKLRITADLQYVDSETDVLDLSVFGGLVGNGLSVDLANNGGKPGLSFRAPNGQGPEFFTNPANYFWRAAMDHIEESEGDEAAIRLDFEYELESDFARSVEAGVRWSERDQTTRWSNYNWGNLSETWANGQSTFDGAANGAGYANDQASAFTFDNFFAGGVEGIPGGTILAANTSLVSDYQTFRNNFDVSNVFRAPLFGRAGDPNSPYIDAEINSTTETNTSAYVRLNFSVDGDRRLDGNVGLRYVNLDTSVGGGITFPLINVGNSPSNGFTADQIAFANGFSSSEAAESSYDTILPSLNVKYEISPELIARFGASKAVAWPDLGNLRYNYNITSSIDTEDGVATLRSFQQVSGNPFLKPLESTNLDLSLEYYFDDADFVSVGVFHKDIKNFFSTTTTTRNVTNPSSGVTLPVEVSQPFNVGSATLSGFEFAYQQFFDELPGVWSGLGMQFNYTYLDPSNVPQQNLRPEQFGGQTDVDRAAVPYDNLPLQGLSESQFNIVGLFENDKWEGRLAYNWRDDYLLTIREVNSSNVGFDVTTFADARGQLDGSVFFRVNDDWQVGVQGTNLLQDEVTTSSQVDASGTRVFRHSYVYDRRFTLVLRGNF